MFRPGKLIELLESNMARTGNPLGLKRSLLSEWLRGLPDLKGRDDTILFTGLMYQLTPYIELSTKYLQKIENSSLEKLFYFYVKLSKYVNPYRFLTLRGSDMERYSESLRRIFLILKKSGIDFTYREDLDGYSGILLYDLGDDSAFSSHAQEISDLLENADVKKIITVDPHTTYALKVLYPEYSGLKVEVASYLEILADVIDKGRMENLNEVVIHDSCYYARYLDIIEHPRKILENMGYRVVEPENSREMTSCCGGPIESISPVFSREIAESRIEELSSAGKKAVTMCPICMGNFERCGFSTHDISDLIFGGMNGSEPSQE